MKRTFDKIRRSFSRPPYYPVQKTKNGSYIFIHINKTGGTSIDKALGLRKAHYTTTQVIEWVGQEAFDAAFKFAVVRNPWSKVVSHYKFRIKNKDEGLTSHPISFKEWVIKTYGLEKDPVYYNNAIMFQPQVDWLKDEQGVIVIDNILRFENLSEEFEKIKSRLDCRKSLPHVNQTQKTDFRSFYDEETTQIIYDWFKEDIDRFGYSF